MELKIVSKLPINKIIENPLVFIHGMWEGSWVWEEYFLDYFVNLGYECHCINLRGHNGSELKGQLRFVTISQYIEDLISFLGTLKVKPILIGHSMGGFIIQKYLENHNARLGFLLGSVPPWGVIRSTVKYFLKKPFTFLFGLFTLDMYKIVNSKEKTKLVFFTDKISQERLDYYYSKIQGESAIAYFGILFLNLVKVKKIKTKLVVIGAEDDWIIPPRLVKGTAKRFGVEAKIFPNLAHNLMLEDSWKDVAKYIDEKIKTLK